MMQSKGSIEGEVSNFKRKTKNKAPAEKMSSYFITFNTNLGYKGKDQLANLENDAEFLQHSVLQPMLNQDLHQFVQFLEPEKNWNDHILQTSGDFAIEVGHAKKRLHAHILLNIKHNTKIQLDYKGMREYLEGKLGLKGIHFNARAIRGANAERNIENYLQKFVDKEQLADEPLEQQPLQVEGEGEGEVDEEQQQEQPVKKRGRPKTKPLPDPNAPKPKRGRPKKTNAVVE